MMKKLVLRIVAVLLPLLHKALYSGGYLYVLAVPDDPGQLYDLPEGVLNELRRIVSRGRAQARAALTLPPHSYKAFRYE